MNDWFGLRPNHNKKANLMNAVAAQLPAPSGFGSVLGAPNLAAGFTDTFTSRYVDTGDVRLHAVIGGGGRRCCSCTAGPRLGTLALLMPALAQHFEVIAVDQRGIGLSDKPGGRLRHGHPRAATSSR